MRTAKLQKHERDFLQIIDYFAVLCWILMIGVSDGSAFIAIILFPKQHVVHEISCSRVKLPTSHFSMERIWTVSQYTCWYSEQYRVVADSQAQFADGLNWSGIKTNTHSNLPICFSRWKVYKFTLCYTVGLVGTRNTCMCIQLINVPDAGKDEVRWYLNITFLETLV